MKEMHSYEMNTSKKMSSHEGNMLTCSNEEIMFICVHMCSNEEVVFSGIR